MPNRLLIFSMAALAAVVCHPVLSSAAGAEVGITWRTNLDAAKMEAAQTGRLLLLHFTTRSCAPCRLLDQQVFNQPQVAAAVERDFVPVRIDADSSPALAAAFRVDRVPMEIILTPDGQQLANPPIPDQPGAFVAQLQNYANHFRQGPGRVNAAPPAGVNPAYSALPVPQSSTSNPFVAPPHGGPASQPASPGMTSVAQQTQQAPPQSQANPYMDGSANPDRYGQAQNVYAPPTQSVAQQGSPSGNQSQQVNPTLAAQTPGLPNNAMPRSYRDPSAGQGAAAGVAMTPDAAAGPSTSPGGNAMLAGVASAGVGAAGAAGSAQQQQTPQVPAGAPPLAFEGHCPIALKTLKRWVPGDAQFGAIHRGRTYLFSGAEQRDQFLANPDAFSPVFAGMDPVLLIDRQQSVEGNRAYGYEYGGSFYLFSSKETMQKFASAPHTYAAGVRQAMSRLDATDGTVRR